TAWATTLAVIRRLSRHDPCEATSVFLNRIDHRNTRSCGRFRRDENDRAAVRRDRVTEHGERHARNLARATFHSREVHFGLVRRTVSWWATHRRSAFAAFCRRGSFALRWFCFSALFGVVRIAVLVFKDHRIDLH